MKLKDWAAFALLGLVWGSSFMWIKLAVAEIGPFLLVALRLLFGILTLLAIAAFTRPTWPRQPQAWRALTILGLINTGIPYVLISWGEQYIDSAVASILNSSTPIFTMLVAHFWLSDDRISRTRLLAVLTGFVGIVILFSRDLTGTSQSSWLGQGAVLLAVLFYAFGTVYARRITQTYSPLVRAVAPLFGADILLWGLAPVIEHPLALPRLPLTWVAVVWLGVMGVAVAFLLYFYLLHSVGPTRTILVTYVFPLVGVALGVIFLRETLDWQLLAGTALIVGSIAVVNRPSRRNHP